MSSNAAYHPAFVSELHCRAQLAEARVALDRAERAHDEDPGSDREARLAEQAERKARLAEARGEARDARVADRPRSNVSDEHPRDNVRGETRERVVDRRATARDERHATAALQSLAQVANVKDEPRGIVIKLCGSLLFPTGEEEVSPVEGPIASNDTSEGRAKQSPRRHRRRPSRLTPPGWRLLIQPPAPIPRPVRS